MGRRPTILKGMITAILNGLIIAVTMSSSSMAAADNQATTPIDPASYLAKIRSRLLGDWPTPVEWDELSREMAKRKCSKPSCLVDFYQKKIMSYTESKRYVAQMASRVDEMIWLRSSPRPYGILSEDFTSSKNFYYQSSTDMGYYNATDELIRRVFSKNLPWDQLYTSQKYAIYPNVNDGGDFSELTFFRQTSKVKSEDHYLSQEVDFTGNPNAAGIFSTPRFLTRFWNSSTNQNRKRTAAIFRIALCDPMMPSIERKGEADVERNLALGLSPEQFKMIHQSTGTVNRHLTDPACIKCHQKIEPMAYTLRGLEGGVSQTGIPGSLRYFISQDQLTDIHADNFSSLVSEITKQPRYRFCQVDQFIKWIIGDDVNLTDERRQQLEAKFDALQRRPNDFIAYLLLTPEFRNGKEDLTETQKNISGIDETQMTIRSNAQKTFAKCNVCHGGGIPSEVSIAQISQVLDLEHDGANRKMPPQQSSWQPTTEEIQAIKSYIKTLTVKP